MTYKVYLLKGQPIENSVKGSNPETFVGVFKAAELIDRCRIPQRDFTNQTGYQRLPGNSRVNKLTRDLRKRNVDLPTALLLSVRDKNISPKLDHSGQYILSLPNDKDSPPPFYVVDGQHRLEGLRKVIQEEEHGYWAEYQLPVVIFFGADEYLEMVQFHTVNSNAKSIPTDLALDLLKTRARIDETFHQHLVETREGWKVVTQELTEELSKRGVWSGSIRFPNQPKGETLISSNAFVSSLKRLLNQDNFASYLPKERVEIIDAYWQGIAKALPTCFENPEKHNIQKTVGINVFHNLLPTILAWATRFGNPVTQAATYEGILSTTLRQLSGVNPQGTDSVGPDFWKSGNAGASGAYSGYAGRNVLVQTIKRDLQENLKEQIL